MKTFITIFLLGIIAITYILSLPQILNDRSFKQYSDQELRDKALDGGLYAVPKEYKELLEIVDKANNKMTHEKIILGKELFFDKLLSKSEESSCATCHLIKKENKKTTTLLTTLSKPSTNSNCVACHLEEESGTDRQESSVGDNSMPNPKHLNTSTILNSSLAKYLSWSGNTTSLEEHVKNSILQEHKLNLKEEELLLRLSKKNNYLKMFNKAFENEEEPISLINTQKAISAYLRTLLTRSSYDEFIEGDDKAISQKAKRGLANFLNFGCKGCHTGMSIGAQSLQRFPLKKRATIYDLRVNVELYPELKIVDYSFPFENKGSFLGQGETNKFRVPILRNVTKTSPYFHNGSIEKIEEAVDIMAKHQLGIHLTPRQRDDIVAFLKTLEGEIVDYKLNNYYKGEKNENN